MSVKNKNQLLLIIESFKDMSLKLSFYPVLTVVEVQTATIHGLLLW